jgi:hypothetical protein
MPPENVDITASRPQRRACGLLIRRECWTLSWRGHLLVLALAVGAAAALIMGIHPFLAVDDPLGARYLVVEGWVPDYALDETLQRFRADGYEQLITTGGWLKSGYKLDQEDTYAHLAASKLQAFGMDTTRLTAIPARLTGRDRTYTTALAVRKWLGESGRGVRAVDIVTLSVHARRTRLLYAKALPADVATGIIAIRNREYDPRRWWRYSEGVKEVMGEGLAYIYARCLFHPPDPEDAAKNPGGK